MGITEMTEITNLNGIKVEKYKQGFSFMAKTGKLDIIGNKNIHGHVLETTP
jgi:hypothetical protein